jgi:lysine decarboxylase
MDRYRRLYNSKESYLLVNGSSGGLIAAILASVPKGGKLVLARNCHKSIFNALSLGDITPVYAYPETVAEYGILGSISPGEIARCLDENPDASAVILPSPNYYGICSDVEAIAEVVHSRGKILIIDQAHGAHLNFFTKHNHPGFPPAAEAVGADMVINSIHKTLASFTQTALLNVCFDRVDKYDLEDRLQAIESTSPSYPMMASLDINADLMEKHGDELMKEWADNLDWFYHHAEQEVPGLQIMRHELLDATKLNIDMSAYGLNGNELEEILMEKDIFIELVTGNILMCMTGIGNKRSDFERLLDALKEIAVSREVKKVKPEQPKAITATLQLTAVPVRKERIKLRDAAGRVCASSVIPYPPGIPIVCPGEIYDEDVIAYIAARRQADEKVIGVDELGRVVVGREE